MDTDSESSSSSDTLEANLLVYVNYNCQENQNPSCREHILSLQGGCMEVKCKTHGCLGCLDSEPWEGA